MYIRCVDCQASTWIENLEAGAKSQTLTCDRCGRRYRIDVPPELGSTQQEQYHRALRLAEEDDIDLPGAYSVLLGIMSLEELRGSRTAAGRPAAESSALRRARPSVPRRIRPRRRRAASVLRDEIPYDPGFRPAVQEGSLSARQAMELGDRELLIATLANAHHLSKQLASEVADNRIPLATALERLGSPTEPVSRKGLVKLSPRHRNWIVAGVVVVMVAVSVHGIRLWNGYVREAREAETLGQLASRLEPRAPATQEQGAIPVDATRKTIAIRADEAGRVVEISGPNPGAVLARFCESASSARRYEPVGLVAAVPPMPGARLGILRDFNNLGSLFAIEIRRDHRSHRWVAGDGSGPIVLTEAPPGTTNGASTHVAGF